MEKTITIKDIEALTQSDAESMMEEKLKIKGHTIYFIDFGGRFGYSATRSKKAMTPEEAKKLLEAEAAKAADKK